MSSPDDFSGIFGIVVAVIAVSVGITWLTGTYGHWIPVIAGLIVGVMAAYSINK
jgi:hypothetical protein